MRRYSIYYYIIYFSIIINLLYSPNASMIRIPLSVQLFVLINILKITMKIVIK